MNSSRPFLVNPALPQTGNRPSDKNNFGPRIGFAADLSGDGKTSLRGGYGMYYGRINGTIIINSLINTGLSTGQAVSSVPANCSAALCGGAANATNPNGNPAAPLFPNILASAPAGTAAVNYLETASKTRSFIRATSSWNARLRVTRLSPRATSLAMDNI